MKRLVLIAAAALVFLNSAPTGLAQTDSLKIGVVDLSRIIQEYDRFQRATVELAAELSKLQDEQQQLDAVSRPVSRELQQLRQQLQQLQESKRGEDGRKQFSRRFFELQKKSSEIAQQQAEARMALRRRSKELSSRKQRMVEATTEEILEAIREKARQEHYSLVLEKTALGTTKYSGLSTPVLIYADETLDMTDDVIAMLNQPPVE